MNIALISMNIALVLMRIRRILIETERKLIEIEPVLMEFDRILMEIEWFSFDCVFEFIERSGFLVQFLGASGIASALRAGLRQLQSVPIQVATVPASPRARETLDFSSHSAA